MTESSKKRYNYEISRSRSQFAEGYVIADNQQEMIWVSRGHLCPSQYEIYCAGEEED